MRTHETRGTWRIIYPNPIGAVMGIEVFAPVLVETATAAHCAGVDVVKGRRLGRSWLAVLKESWLQKGTCSRLLQYGNRQAEEEDMGRVVSMMLESIGGAMILIRSRKQNKVIKP